MTSERTLAAWHESGHAVIGTLLDMETGPAVINDEGRGQATSHWRRHDVPEFDQSLLFPLWPAVARDRVEAMVIMLLAGSEAELLPRASQRPQEPLTGRLPATTGEAAIEAWRTGLGSPHRQIWPGLQQHWRTSLRAIATR